MGFSGRFVPRRTCRIRLLRNDGEKHDKDLQLITSGKKFLGTSLEEILVRYVRNMQKKIV